MDIEANAQPNINFNNYINEDVIVKTYHAEIRGQLVGIKEKEVIILQKNVGEVYIPSKEIKSIRTLKIKTDSDVKKDTSNIPKELWVPKPPTCWRYFFTPTSISSDETEIQYINNTIVYNAVQFSFAKYFSISGGIALGSIHIHPRINYSYNKYFHAGVGYMYYLGGRDDFFNGIRGTLTVGNNLNNISLTAGTGKQDFDKKGYLYAVSGQISVDNSFGFIFELINRKNEDDNHFQNSNYLVVGWRLCFRRMQIKPVYIRNTATGEKKSNQYFMFTLERAF